MSTTINNVAVRNALEDSIRTILSEIGEDVNREGLLDTPKRVAKMYREVFAGVGVNPETALTTTFAEEYDGIITVKDITYHTFCEHHLIPFFGKAHIGYIPDGRVVGLSKFARLVELTAQRPQVQERMTMQLANAIVNVLSPKGVIVTVEGAHLCMCARGIKKPGTSTITTIKKGVFAENVALCEEFERSISRS
ncbi:GTP cyclohydrolase I FolE [Paenibacillus alginolyticus]|uniref:GTP cyclohydrolase 1 n=1 Tax=Paenibacillus alginolyticus TaxID=59839 RepID=A0ABT4G9S5_9BACL|nr:GTP cyclohydrolase I FolE [Paenibacillus alginolyticus]MCY9669898.1 GTP cyclohydrolase I FolE [Paenibacillus alginolyticus]MCY9692942.1 GTP cyclohydrolase I FolE [Paenibacillus alginolyticus]MEC0144317.1 GTP cyclohydrolase I FolE [Paenibacillus alginolyticus]